MFRYLLSLFAPLHFSSPAPRPAWQPPDPGASVAARQKRLDMEAAASLEASQGGRRSTNVGGALMAAEEQQKRGDMLLKKRGASADMGM